MVEAKKITLKQYWIKQFFFGPIEGMLGIDMGAKEQHRRWKAQKEAEKQHKKLLARKD